jgi:hypothetical protein
VALLLKMALIDTERPIQPLRDLLDTPSRRHDDVYQTPSGRCAIDIEAWRARAKHLGIVIDGDLIDLEALPVPNRGIANQPSG